jgi:hypothetical protein
LSNVIDVLAVEGNEPCSSLTIGKPIMGRMAAERESPNLTDYVVTALSPLLIMLMVGSLVFFLVEVLYAGKYSGKLLYTLFFFVLGAVLVARISIEADAARASLYGLFLGIVTYIALLTYVEYPGGGWLTSFGWLVNLGLMLLIWWSAHRLTWDCTHIDETRKGAGRGLLSAAGLDADSPVSGTPQLAQPKARSERPRRGTKQTKPDSRLWDWIERYQKYREDRRKAPHTPGVWVIYFALAALPLFALGQSLIDPGDEKRRQATFLQMLVYVGSSLALLVTTSLLGLRRYLRQRKAKIPSALTASWLGFGAVLIVVFLVLGAFLPRPHSEVPWFGIARAGKSDREASKHAISTSGAGKGEGRPGDQVRRDPNSKATAQGKPGSGKGNSEQQSGGNSSKTTDSPTGGKKTNTNGKAGDADTQDTDRKDNANRDPERGSSGNTSSGNTDEETSDAAGSTDQTRQATPQTQLGVTVQKIAAALKWVVFALVAVLVILACAVALLRYLAPFTDWARRLLDALRDWWAGLFGQRQHQSARVDTTAELLATVRPPPFHAFVNPFADGSAETRDPAELTLYTFSALDAWAWDHDSGREPTETPLEFAARLAEQFPELTESLVRFGRLYARVSYSENPLPDDAVTTLESLWDGLVHGRAVTSAD